MKKGNKQLLSVDSTYLDLDWQKLFGKDELIKALERLKYECNNPSINAGYKEAIMDAIGLVEKLAIPTESQQRELLLEYEASRYETTSWTSETTWWASDEECENRINEFLTNKNK
jgi:hypothetical protein